jgi:hypothetical protein
MAKSAFQWLFVAVLLAGSASAAGAQEAKKLRVLIVAGAPVRDYQFLRTMLAREADAKRMDVADLLQSGRDNVGGDDAIVRLTEFPDRLGKDAPKKPGMNLSDYDVIFAFDPDWSQLSAKQLGLLQKWVSEQGGGFFFVAGRANSHQLARPAKELEPLLPLIPVVLKDHRLQEQEKVAGPYTLKFGKEKPKLDDKGDGWERYFGNVKGGPGTIPQPERGFYSCYPVAKLKPAAIVIATFAGPKDLRINDGKDDPPFLVRAAVGKGKTMYLGSGEIWRLRTIDQQYHQRFWLQAAQSLAAGAAPKAKKGDQ